MNLLKQSPRESGIGQPLNTDFAHWRLEYEQGGAIWLLLDQTEAGNPRTTNVLSASVLEELAKALDIVVEKNPTALIVRSAKSSSFIVGADVREFEGERDNEKICNRLRQAQTLLERIEKIGCPTIALIHGHCLGGGLELALACDYRIARDDAQLGFPEVQLGLHPGLGGTVRLPRLIDPASALTMMLTGKPMRANEAKSAGLIDAVVPERHVAAVIRSIVGGEFEAHSPGIKDRVLESGPGRRVIAARARKETESRTKAEHYPAPFALIDLFESPGGDTAHMFENERRSFAELLAQDAAQNLVRVFLLRDALNSSSREDSGIDNVHVIGAGIMGGDIAAWMANSGKRVTLQDQSAQLLTPAVKRAKTLFDDKQQYHRDRRAASDRFVPDVRGSGKASADCVIEAVPERLDLKREVLAEIESAVQKNTLIATNTSSILLADMRSALDSRMLFAGLHFFNPVAKMALVEVVADETVASEVVERLTALCIEIGKLPIQVKSSPGFLVNRVLTPYLLEALVLMDEGYSRESIDAAAEAFGMPVGPVELSDQIGLDICLDVADTLIEKLDQALPDVPVWLREKVENEELGIKSGSGLYDYKDGEPVKADADEQVSDELIDRLVLPIINTAVMCLDEGVVADRDLLDGALIFGTGFAPFTGGPVHYAHQRGADEVRTQLETFTERFGQRYAPASGWSRVFAD